MISANDQSVEQRLASIERHLAKITEMLDQGPTMLSMATDSIDEWARGEMASGISIEERLQTIGHLAKRLSDPAISSSLNSLLDFTEQAPGLVSMVADTLDETLAGKPGQTSFDDKLKAMNHLLDRVTDPSTQEKLDNLFQLADQAPGLVAMVIDSIDDIMAGDYLVKNSIEFIQQGNEALSEAKHQKINKVGGLFGLMRTLKDPDRQKALGFLMNVLKNLGKKL